MDQIIFAEGRIYLIVCAALITTSILVTSIACMICAVGSFWQALRQTFAPMTWREFIFPKCSLCWIARGTVTASIGLTLFLS